MKKKLTALALSAALTAGMLAGCGGQTSAEQTAVEVPTEPFGDTIKYDPSVEINNGEPISLDLWEWAVTTCSKRLSTAIRPFTPMSPSIW